MLYVFAYYSARVAVCNFIRRNAFGDDATCPDRNIISNRHAGQNDDASANPYVVANDDRSRPRFAKGKGAVRFWFAESVCRVGRVKGGIDLHVGGNQGIIPDDNLIRVQKSAVQIDFTIVSKVNIRNYAEFNRSFSA